jgi:hypothetical protein
VRLLLLLGLVAGCDPPAPVLRAVDPPRTAEAVAERRAASELRASPSAVEAAYVKAPGVYIDARYLGGRAYRAVRAEVEEQLGAVLEEQEPSGTPGGEGVRSVVFERGTLRLAGDTIQMIEVPLPEPVRRTEALGMLGFPPATGHYLALSLEFRLTNTWGFRRIRFFRAARGSEDVTRVQVWKSSDGDE